MSSLLDGYQQSRTRVSARRGTLCSDPVDAAAQQIEALGPNGAVAWGRDYMSEVGAAAVSPDVVVRVAEIVALAAELPTCGEERRASVLATIERAVTDAVGFLTGHRR